MTSLSGHAPVFRVTRAFCQHQADYTSCAILATVTLLLPLHSLQSRRRQSFVRSKTKAVRAAHRPVFIRFRALLVPGVVDISGATAGLPLAKLDGRCSEAFLWLPLSPYP
jgi:hypothetical protein